MTLRSPYRQNDASSNSQAADAVRFRFLGASSALRCAFEVFVRGPALAAIVKIVTYDASRRRGMRQS